MCTYTRGFLIYQPVEQPSILVVVCFLNRHEYFFFKEKTHQIRMGHCLLNTCSSVRIIKNRQVELHIPFQDKFEEERQKIICKIHHLEKRISKMETCLEERKLKHREKIMSDI